MNERTVTYVGRVLAFAGASFLSVVGYYGYEQNRQPAHNVRGKIEQIVDHAPPPFIGVAGSHTIILENDGRRFHCNDIGWDSTAREGDTVDMVVHKSLSNDIDYGVLKMTDHK